MKRAGASGKGSESETLGPQAGLGLADAAAEASAGDRRGGGLSQRGRKARNASGAQEMGWTASAEFWSVVVNQSTLWTEWSLFSSFASCSPPLPQYAVEELLSTGNLDMYQQIVTV